MTIRASFHGSLGRNSEVKTVGDNNKVTKFSVASNSGYGDKTVSYTHLDVYKRQG